MQTPRRIVVSVTHDTIHGGEGPWTYCLPMTDAYCKLHAIPFQHIVVKNTPENRAFSWTKVPILHKFIQTYDQVMFVSNNATIINQGVDIFEYIQSAPEESKWPRRSSTKPVLYTLSDRSAHGNPLTGIFMLDCTDKKAAEKFLNDWWNEDVDPYTKQNYPYEQHPFTTPTWRANPARAALIRVANVWSIQEIEKDQVFFQITPVYKNIQTYEAKRAMFRMLNNKRKRVGIFVRQSNYYASGAGQNCIFIKHSLEAAGYEVDLLVQYDPSKPAMVDPQIPYMYINAPKITDTNSGYAAYSFILYGSQIPDKATREHIRSLGIPTAMFHPMNSYDAVHSDHFIHNTPTSIPLFEEAFHTFADEVWLTQNHEVTYKQLLEIQNASKVPVRVIPLSWAPVFTLYNGIQYTYKNKPDATKMDILIMEPSVSYCKNAWLPLVVAEAFYMKHKDNVNKVYLFGNESAIGKTMTSNLSISKDMKLRRIGRMPINDILRFFCHTEPNNKVAVISHNIQIPLNYAYYDVMNAGIPLLHNSDLLEYQGLGYAYNTVQSGLAHLETVLYSHNSQTYNQTVQSALASISPYNEVIVRRFEHAITKDASDSVYGCVVSTQNKERLDFIHKQLKDIQFPYKYTVFGAYTPTDSRAKDYFDMDVQQVGFVSTIKKQMYQCGVRSHIDAMNTCLNNSSAEYFLMMEDDVAFQTGLDIKSDVTRYIDILKRHPDIHYLSLVYRPYSSSNKRYMDECLSGFQNRDGDVYWDTTHRSDSPHVWGAQAYLISRNYARKFVDMFSSRRVSELAFAVEAAAKACAVYSPRVPQLIIDSLMPVFMNQGFVYPMLGVERMFTHSISADMEIENIWKTFMSRARVQYYSFPASLPVPPQPEVAACIVSTMNPQRIAFMETQMGALKFSYPYHTYKAVLPADLSAEGFIDMPQHNEPDILLCCMRSHIGALHECLQKYPADTKYFMILEDDVALDTNVDIVSKIQAYIRILETTPQIGYISLSYLPVYLDGQPIHTRLDKLSRVTDDVYYGFDKPSVDFTIWGSQAYLISRKNAEILVSIFHHNKLSVITSNYNDYLSKNRTYANKTPHKTIDAIMPFIFNQAIAYPMLAIEQNFDESISDTTLRRTQWSAYVSRNSATHTYYCPPR